MKKILFIGLAAAMVFVVRPAAAQNEQNEQTVQTAQNAPKSQWGVRVGLNVASVSGSTAWNEASSKSRASFHVGVAYEHVLANKLPLYLETGLYLSGRGGSFELKEAGYSEKQNMLYLQLPVVVSWHFNIKDKVSIQPAFGVYYGYGISGKSKAMQKDGGETYKYNEKLFKKEDGSQPYKHSDLGLRLAVGVTIHQRYYAGLGYDFGLMNINKETDSDDPVVHNNSFYISVGYNF